MRKQIISKRDRSKKQKRNQLILGLGLMIVMLFSVIGYGFVGRPDDDSGAAEKIIVNNVEFVNANGLYGTEIGGIQFIFSNNPMETYTFNETVNYANSYSGLPLYISSKNDLVSAEIYTNLIQIAERIQKACLVNSSEPCEEDLPFKDCSNNFIIVQESNETSVIQEENCVFIQGPKENLLNITDGFLLKTLGISS